VLPADHHIADVPGFLRTAEASLAHAGEHLVTIGIVPTHPETGYGYIRRGPPLDDAEATAPHAAHRVAGFVEKPDLATAAEYLAGGEHLWNAGMFFMSAELFLAELALHRPALAAAITGADDVLAAWPGLESISIDHAVMERSSRILVVPGSFGWSDVGSWRALHEHRQGASFHHGDVVELDGHDNVLFSEGGLVAVVGVSDLVVVHTPDATLVCPRESAQRAREVVQALERAKRSDLL
jgi:mannose-1-phosphate guanylyltransferase